VNITRNGGDGDDLCKPEVWTPFGYIEDECLVRQDDGSGCNRERKVVDEKWDVSHDCEWSKKMQSTEVRRIPSHTLPTAHTIDANM